MKKRILIIEDEVPLRNALSDKLTREGYAVLTAKNGEVGLGAALHEHPDLILLDIVMPVMDGLSMLKELRKNKWGKTARVIILTNLVSDNQRVNQYLTQTKLSYYLVKSNWKIKDVVVKVRQRLGE